MRALPLRSIWQIVSEINLAEIQRELESTFHLLIAADDGSVAEHAARSLSGPAADFVHPWITVTDGSGSGLRSDSTNIVPSAAEPRKPPPGAPRTVPDCVLLVTTQMELSADLASLLQTLNAQSIPSLIVVTGPEGQKAGAEIARRGEQARVAVPDLSAPAAGPSTAPAASPCFPSAHSGDLPGQCQLLIHHRPGRSRPRAGLCPRSRRCHRSYQEPAHNGL